MSQDTLAREKPAVKKLHPKGAARRALIMDAAEEVFSERGYFGSTMRDVSARSGAALGLISHYFPSKEILLREIVARKFEQLHHMVAASLADSEKQSGGLENLIDAFIRPFLRACVDPNSDIRSYIKLTSHFMSTYHLPEVKPVLAELTPVTHLFREYLGRAMPDLSDRNLRIAAYLIDATLIFMVQDTGFVDAVSEGQYTSEVINELIHPAVVFFTGGVRALANQA